MLALLTGYWRGHKTRASTHALLMCHCMERLAPSTQQQQQQPMAAKDVAGVCVCVCLNKKPSKQKLTVHRSTPMIESKHSHDIQIQMLAKQASCCPVCSFFCNPHLLPTLTTQALLITLQQRQLHSQATLQGNAAAVFTI